MRNKNIVTIGGGTGSFVLLSGLKKYPVNLSAIVSMADDGGSTGVLRDELGVLPPGDIRQCLVALSESSKELRDLMNYRFESGGLKGHNFGNIFLSALEKVSGSFSKGVEEAIKILDVEGEVIPVSENPMKLCIKLKNGKVLIGENNLDHNEEIRKVGIKKVFLKPEARAFSKAVEKIKKADYVIIGPGDLFGSIIPNLLAGGISNAIKKSKAKIIFVCSLTNKKGQSEGFTLDDYIKIINSYIGKERIDIAIFNSKKIPVYLVEEYEKQEGKKSTVMPGGKSYDYKITMADILKSGSEKKLKNDAIAHTRSFIRHDSEKLAKTIFKIINY